MALVVGRGHWLPVLIGFASFAGCPELRTPGWLRRPARGR
jgi:hypothetical protein